MAFYNVQNILRREADFTLCCIIFELQFCHLAVKYKNLAVKYNILYCTCENISFWKHALYFSNMFYISLTCNDIICNVYIINRY